ncbi:MAG: hypothetical protein KBT13_11575, partial [Bacteroidales bacterium]|nr:hypothetical protein [Candidatus Sodaliphilus limicaballi]
CILCMAIMLLVSSCFTGVENTPKITDKDVSRTINELERRQPTMTLTTYRDSLPSWRQGKRFYVTDDNVKLIFTQVAGDNMDSVKLVGRILSYKGYDTSLGLDGRDVVDIHLADGSDEYVYHTGKTEGEFLSTFSIPLLIDMDVVEHVSRQLEGKEVYIKTPIWYNIDGEYMIHGRQYIKVHIDEVLPGNKVLPLRVLFTASDNKEKAFVWMSAGQNAINNRDYDSMFSSKDLHDSYPEISGSHWEMIKKGEVETGMTKEECRLAKGAPKKISRMPDQTAVREFWYYDGGSYLQFVDGLLKNFRK